MLSGSGRHERADAFDRRPRRLHRPEPQAALSHDDRLEHGGDGAERVGHRQLQGRGLPVRLSFAGLCSVGPPSFGTAVFWGFVSCLRLLVREVCEVSWFVICSSLHLLSTSSSRRSLSTLSSRRRLFTSSSRRAFHFVIPAKASTSSSRRRPGSSSSLFSWFSTFGAFAITDSRPCAVPSGILPAGSLSLLAQRK